MRIVAISERKKENNLPKDGIVVGRSVNLLHSKERVQRGSVKKGL